MSTEEDQIAADLDSYTPEDITWRAYAFVFGEPVGYIAQLGFRMGFGGMLTLIVRRHEGAWHAKIEGGRAFALPDGYLTPEQAQDAAVTLAVQALGEMITELSHLVRNTQQARRPPKLSKGRRRLTRATSH